MTAIATLSASRGAAGHRHALLAIGSGFTGLTATKALKFSQMNVTDALVFVTRIAAQSMSHLASQGSQWTPFAPAVVTASVLLALGVAGVDPDCGPRARVRHAAGPHRAGERIPGGG